VEGGVLGGEVGEFNGQMTPPKLLAGPPIEYTDEALEHDVEGVMVVRCILSTAGDVRQCEVKQSVPFMDAAVVASLLKRRYTPVTLEGKPVTVYFNFRIRLILPR
jgi:protein TonB